MRTFKIIPVVIALSLADFGTTILFTRWLGATLTYSLFAVPMLLGLYIQWRRWKVVRKYIDAQIENAKAERSSGQNTPPIPANAIAKSFYWSITTILLLVPGLVTAGMAFVLMLPSSQRKVESWMSTGMSKSKHDQQPTELAETPVAAAESVEGDSTGVGQTDESRA